eukprot:TRINITY_DN2408_c0_g1_i2.p1 TRINITY_DN2408_c0_g1~~TRINITY_DN2408_c0_g1_i2.p1  ORF type:complete len:178 (+),score=22.34 TRINITY_DN2408_c0_g1_i2:632-1165(+)
MRDLHPEPIIPELPFQPARIDEVLAVNVLKFFKKGVVGSLTGLQPQHVINVLEAPLYTPISTSLANLLNLITGGLACEAVRPYLIGAKCFALGKGCNVTGEVFVICPVTNGNFERKWVSKCLLGLNGWILSGKLTSECIGIGVSCAMELVVHTIWKYWRAAPTDQNTLLLQVDARNV